jgi:hypothetical protein
LTIHPSPEVLALYSSADLPLSERWRIRRHLAHCEECEHQLHIFRASTAELCRQAATETLTGFEAIADWSHLEREMVGNITVGLAAARCIEKNTWKRAWALRAALASGFALLFVLGWLTHVPPAQSHRIFSVVGLVLTFNRPPEAFGPILRTQPNGIVVGSSEGSLTILHPAGAIVSLSGPTSVEARYVDEETGQVTITDVYGQ